MYAISETGYRAVSSPADLLPGESLADTPPQSLLDFLDAVEIRAQRDALLRSSDWTQIPDAPLTEQQRSGWGAYRQALRDLTAHPEFPRMPWPTPPSLGGESADLG